MPNGEHGSLPAIRHSEFVVQGGPRLQDEHAWLMQCAMAVASEPMRPIELDDIKSAQKRIAGTIIRTPLIRLELGSEFPEIWLKLENLQPINAYKLRGAANAVAMLSDAERQ